MDYCLFKYPHLSLIGGLAIFPTVRFCLSVGSQLRHKKRNQLSAHMKLITEKTLIHWYYSKSAIQCQQKYLKVFLTPIRRIFHYRCKKIHMKEIHMKEGMDL